MVLVSNETIKKVGLGYSYIYSCLIESCDSTLQNENGLIDGYYFLVNVEYICGNCIDEEIFFEQLNYFVKLNLLFYEKVVVRGYDFLKVRFIEQKFLPIVKKEKKVFIPIENKSKQRKQFNKQLHIDIDIDKFVNEIDINSLQLYRLDTEGVINRGECIYLLYKRTELIYIGETVNIIDRFRSHLQEKEFDSYKLITYPFEYTTEVDHHFTRKRLETLLISKYKPLLNKKIA